MVKYVTLVAPHLNNERKEKLHVAWTEDGQRYSHTNFYLFSYFYTCIKETTEDNFRIWFPGMLGRRIQWLVLILSNGPGTTLRLSHGSGNTVGLSNINRYFSASGAISKFEELGGTLIRMPTRLVWLLKWMKDITSVLLQIEFVVSLSNSRMKFI